ncbi:GPI inositol-deacylase [Actinotalea sp. M2MS4P-6]|uniref:esterase/lipase family protein n=1 Tax=Actinotalea sp. M2MS4P-6 TaxID=2983762 RepID=UPI0021E4C936|nr:GPI inositol-deacylase [Actinotalea sp. M2MS4P-6]MCV2395276.1 GPI inositol-deacylase [Actinotalea sp. M2MS4P-6]
MSNPAVAPTGPRPLILIRGFGGPDVSDETASPYQGFNDGTVYPDRRGENYIYEGFVLRALKSADHPYRDATNVVGYYADDIAAPPETGGLEPDDVHGTVVLDPATEAKVLSQGTAGTIWIYRYYDLQPRALARYGQGLLRLVHLIEACAQRRGEQFDGVDVVAHSMGGLVAREGVLAMDAAEPGYAKRAIHRIVTLGTPHRGISFQRVPDWLLRVLPGVEKASDELASFDPSSTRFREWNHAFDPRHVLTVVGTNYRTYGVRVATKLNRLSSLLDDGSLVYNRSDGLVKQASAQLPGAPRTFVNKCHGGHDSLVTSREAFEIAMRFFHGTHRVALSLDSGAIKRGGDWFGRSEFYLGVSVKPRYVDFELFHQSPDAENCYGPFHENDLSDDMPDLATELDKPLAEFGDRTTGWAGPGRLIWEGWVDGQVKPDQAQGLVFRLDFYIGERDTFGIGFSDNVVYRKQYYVQAFPGSPPELFIHTGEKYLAGDLALDQAGLRAKAGAGAGSEVQAAAPIDGSPGEWTFDIGGTGFDGRFRISIHADA